MSGADPIFEDCYKSYPERPVIDPATTLYTRAEVERKVDYWMGELSRLAQWGSDQL